jgi:hypothetical protein
VSNVVTLAPASVERLIVSLPESTQYRCPPATSIASPRGVDRRLNRPKYGKRPDNERGEQAEMNLDIEHEGRPLTEVFEAHRNNFGLIKTRSSGSEKGGRSLEAD